MTYFPGIAPLPYEVSDWLWSRWLSRAWRLVARRPWAQR